MSKQQRWNKIIDLCKYQDNINVAELVSILGVSEATVRRDLSQMEELNMINRFYGGAKLNQLQYDEPPMLIKTSTNSNEKKLIARLAANMIKDNQMVYIDAGSTTYEMLNYITAKNITVTTIGVAHMNKLVQMKINTIVLGGNLHWQTEAITGNQTLKQLEDLYFDVAFIGVNGIHEQVGLTTSNEQEASVKKKAIEHSHISYALADSSKVNILNAVKFSDLDQVIIISDAIENFDLSKIKYMLTSEIKNKI
ncbi:DeoR/GlpR family DNA-binding transcription regulator [Anaerorhabdus furcosa]|uniref:Transcriptional regulator, DeoR family n=1 Tax=Anaerorhabdus furcosa TaxID=118967 RepID=A0A1T4NPR1_9FIRM|nr:DeoR/GlpR family DNA-binding transcription regulator [Anaerorhabdus furcosa]SJZ81203.1 transcriptional regulator, DeoR family [Anaerorhabdus furcosa]